MQQAVLGGDGDLVGLDGGNVRGDLIGGRMRMRAQHISRPSAQSPRWLLVVVMLMVMPVTGPRLRMYAHARPACACRLRPVGRWGGGAACAGTGRAV